jgi:hypothetical protein
MNDRGVALILVLLVMMTICALAMSLALMISTESRVAATYRDGVEVFYGADAALHRVLPDLAVGDPDLALTGRAVSSFTDGAPGPRRLPDGTLTDLHVLTSMVNCDRAVCSDADLDEVREDRPWGTNNPRWRLYGYGSLSTLGNSRVYAVVWVADDPSETDGDPFTDGGGAENPGRGRLTLTAHGYGPAGTRRVVEATVSKTSRGFSIISWREVR